MKRKRILAISGVFTGMKPFFIYGKNHIEGMPAYANSLFGLLKYGYEVHLLCLTDQTTNPPELENLYVYDILKGNSSVSFCKGIQDTISYLKVLYIGIRMLHRLQFDLIYGYGGEGMLAGILSLFTRIPNARRIFGSFLYYRFTKGTLLQKLKTYIKLKHLVMSLPTSALIISNDGTHGDKAAMSLGQTPSKIHYLYNGVDKDLKSKIDIQYARQVINNIRKDEKKPILVNVSRLDYWKRVDRAIMSLKYIEYKPSPILLIAGDGPYRQELEQLAEKNGLGDSVYFLGQISHEKALSIISMSDISLSLYDYANLGNVLIESMILGKCIITLNDGSLCGLIEDGINGILLDDSSPQSVAGAMDGLLNDPNRMQEYSRKTMEKAFKTFDTWDERIRKEINIIESSMSPLSKY